MVYVLAVSLGDFTSAFHLPARSVTLGTVFLLLFRTLVVFIFFVVITSHLAIPRAKRFIDPAVGIVGCFLGGELFLHPTHPGTEGIPTGATFRLGCL